MTSTVEVLVEAFRDAGTPFIVGHPGGESVEMIEAARQRDMRFILMKQETAGAMLASTWGELTGSPGVCLSTRGPGAANMVNGVTHAFMDRAPLIAITDQYSGPTYEVALRQRLNQLALYAPITKWNTSINAKTVQQQVRRGLRVATSPAPGPVQFDMPQSETTREADPLPTDAPLLPNVVTMVPDRSGLKATLDMLNRSKKPVLLVGLGTFWARCCPEMVALAEKIGAPVLVTTKCKGAIPEDHPLRAGIIIGGLIERNLIMEADLIITVGLDTIELQPKAWPYKTPVLSLASVQSPDGSVPASMEVIGDLKEILKGLAEWGPNGDWGHKAARNFRDELTKALNTPSNGISPQRAMEVARAALPRDTVASCDAGASRLLVVQKWVCYGQGEFVTSNGLGSMGFAVPGALGLRLANPEKPVVAFAGDGGIMMAVADLQTSVKENLPITVVVFDDQEIGLIRIKQELKGIPRYGVGLGGVNWEKLAQGFGAEGTVVDSENQLGDALSQAATAKKTTLIAVRIDPSGYVEQFNALREI